MIGSGATALPVEMNGLLVGRKTGLRSSSAFEVEGCGIPESDPNWAVFLFEGGSGSISGSDLTGEVFWFIAVDRDGVGGGGLAGETKA